MYFYNEPDIKVTGTFAPRNFRSRERKFHRWNFRSRERKFHGTFAPRNESSMELSFPGANYPWNFRSRERKFHGTFAPKREKKLELTLVSNRKCNEFMCAATRRAMLKSALLTADADVSEPGCGRVLFRRFCGSLKRLHWLIHSLTKRLGFNV